jgi:glycosyltransferase involved in cell wall biosynthesis
VLDSITAMPRVLMLARHFPPVGGAGVHRTVGSVRHLPEHGYDPVVVTAAAQHRDRWEPRDEELLERIPQDVPVHRVPEGPSGSPSRLERLTGRPPAWVRSWVDQSARLGREVGGDSYVIYASCLPYETAVAAARVAQALGRPWIADLEDPWALDEMRVALSRAHRALDLRQMRRALATASAVVMSAPEAAERVRAAMPDLASRVEIVGIPIGFEPADFDIAPAPREDSAFRIVHTGSMHTDLGEHLRRTRTRQRLLGGVAPGLDVLTRSHVYLVEAIARAVAADPSLEGRIELHLAGQLTDEDRAVADRHPFVRTPGLLAHRETVALMRSADLLFLPMHDLPAGRRAGLIPYKTYEYLAAGRPILAAVPDGDVRDMLAPLAQATVVRPSDVRAMAEAVRARHTAATAQPDGREPDAEPPQAYVRVRSVARIAEVLDSVVSAAGAPAVAA